MNIYKLFIWKQNSYNNLKAKIKKIEKVAYPKKNIKNKNNNKNDARIKIQKTTTNTLTTININNKKRTKFKIIIIMIVKIHSWHENKL